MNKDMYDAHYYKLLQNGTLIPKLVQKFYSSTQ